MKQNYHSESSSATKMETLKKLMKEEFETKMSSVEKQLYLETLDSRVIIAKQRIQNNIKNLEIQNNNIELIRKIHSLLMNIMQIFEERKTLKETDNSILEALETIDINESSFKALMNRYKLDKILSFYLSGDAKLTN